MRGTVVIIIAQRIYHHKRLINARGDSADKSSLLKPRMHSCFVRHAHILIELIYDDDGAIALLEIV